MEAILQNVHLDRAMNVPVAERRISDAEALHRSLMKGVIASIDHIDPRSGLRYPPWVQIGPRIVSQSGGFRVVHRGLREEPYRQGV